MLFVLGLPPLWCAPETDPNAVYLRWVPLLLFGAANADCVALATGRPRCQDYTGPCKHNMRRRRDAGCSSFAAALRTNLVEGGQEEIGHKLRSTRLTHHILRLQGHIWHGGFASGALQAKMYGDVAPALAHWHSLGIKTYIYSSGSRCV